jgi:hypothetical protein
MNISNKHTTQMLHYYLDGWTGVKLHTPFLLFTAETEK